MSSKAYFKQIYFLYKEIKKNLYIISQKLGFEQYFDMKKSEISFLKPNKIKLNTLKNTIKSKYGSIPISYFLLYYIMNGQNSLEVLENYRLSPLNFFGGFSYYQQYFEYSFQSLASFLCDFLSNLKFHPLAKAFHQFYLFIDFGNFLGYGNETIFSIISKENGVNGLEYTIFVLKFKLLIQEVILQPKALEYELKLLIIHVIKE